MPVTSSGILTAKFLQSADVNEPPLATVLQGRTMVIHRTLLEFFLFGEACPSK